MKKWSVGRGGKSLLKMLGENHLGEELKILEFSMGELPWMTLWLNSINLNHDMYKMRLAVSPHCECNQEERQC